MIVIAEGVEHDKGGIRPGHERMRCFVGQFYCICRYFQARPVTFDLCPRSPPFRRMPLPPITSQSAWPQSCFSTRGSRLHHRVESRSFTRTTCSPISILMGKAYVNRRSLFFRTVASKSGQLAPNALRISALFASLQEYRRGTERVLFYREERNLLLRCR